MWTLRWRTWSSTLWPNLVCRRRCRCYTVAARAVGNRLSTLEASRVLWTQRTARSLESCASLEDQGQGGDQPMPLGLPNTERLEHRHSPGGGLVGARLLMANHFLLIFDSYSRALVGQSAMNGGAS